MREARMAGGCRHDFPLVIFLDKLHSLSLARPSAAGRAVQDNIYLLLPERGSARFSMNPLTSFFLCSHGHVHPPTSVTSVLFLNSTWKAKSWGGAGCGSVPRGTVQGGWGSFVGTCGKGQRLLKATFITKGKGKQQLPPG